MKRKSFKFLLGTVGMAIALGVDMLGGSIIYAQAADNHLANNATNGITPVTTTVVKAYTVTIPAGITIAPTESQNPVDHNFDIKAKNVFLEKNNRLSVALNTSNTFKLNNNTQGLESEYISYLIKSADGSREVPKGEKLISFDAGITETTASFKLTNVNFANAKHIGKYTGNLIFDITTSA